MPFGQLHHHGLMSGDLLLEAYDSTFTALKISIGQRIAGQANTKVVHAGVMFDPTDIIEAVGAGIAKNNLAGVHSRCGYLVFRCRNQEIATSASILAEIMFDAHQNQGTGPYSVIGAMKTAYGRQRSSPDLQKMEKMLDGLLSGDPQPVFCSMFVVTCFQLAAEANGISAAEIFPWAAEKMSPGELAKDLERNYLFEEVGYILPV
jgi:hypothetical protein